MKSQREKTAEFKKYLRIIYSKILEEEISEFTAWKLYNASIAHTVSFVSDMEDNRLPLNGIGIFEVQKTKHRNAMDGTPSKLEQDGVPFVPKFKFYPSTRIKAWLLKKFFNYEKPIL